MLEDIKDEKLREGLRENLEGMKAVFDKLTTKNFDDFREEVVWALGLLYEVSIATPVLVYEFLVARHKDLEGSLETLGTEVLDHVYSSTKSKLKLFGSDERSDTTQ
jgi:hypothetical protein